MRLAALGRPHRRVEGRVACCAAVVQRAMLAGDGDRDQLVRGPARR
jgi:hypothetical protein